jgi:oligopeptide transport system permease protein
MSTARRIVRLQTVLALIVLIALAGPHLSPWGAQALDWDAPSVAPTWVHAHVFGTDTLGRDVWVRACEGLRVSLLIAVAATVLGLLIGGILGAMAGSLGGVWDVFVMRLVDVGYALPVVLVALLLTVVLGRGVGALLVAASTVGWLSTARMVRSETRRLALAPYVLAATVIGVPRAAIFLRHVLPNLIGPVLVHATLTVPSLVVLESFLSFLGLGVQEPAASLGNLLHDGAREMERAPWLLIAPALLLVWVVGTLTALGEAWRDRIAHAD